MATIKTPEVETQFQIGDSFIYVIEVEEDVVSHSQYGSYAEGRTRVTGHDDLGNEVEVWFYPRKPEDGWYEDEAEARERVLAERRTTREDDA